MLNIKYVSQKEGGLKIINNTSFTTALSQHGLEMFLNLK